MHTITAHLNARLLQPMHRSDLFEDPLSELLEARNLGTVSGGGTLLGDNREIISCDIEIV